jgi:hypothetical protein
MGRGLGEGVIDEMGYNGHGAFLLRIRFYSTYLKLRSNL